MREHQIVISLKPEQFQEVQKQARAAGAQSVGAFVRQNLLIFLGLEESDAAKKGSPISDAVQADPDWRFIAGELRRLHRELKVLASEATVSTTLLTDIAGSTSGPMLASSVGLSEFSEQPAEYKQPAVPENFLTDGAPVTADDYPDDLEDSLILPPAHGVGGGTTPFFQTPTLPTRSPFGLPMPSGQLPLSSPFGQHTFMSNISPLPSDLGATAQTAAPTPAETLPQTPAPEPAPALPHKQQFTVEEGAPVETTKISAFPTEPQPLAQPPLPEAKEVVAQNAPVTQASPALPAQPQAPIDPATAAPAAATEPQATPVAQQAAQPVSPPPPPPVSPEPADVSANLPASNPTISAAPIAQTPAHPAATEPQTAFTPQKDDMEVLADRAFAISPRLGAIEPEVTLQPAPTRSFADTLEELLDAGLINQVLGPEEEPGAEYAGEVEAPPEDDMVQVIVQEIEVPSSDEEVENESSATADNSSDSEPAESEPPPPRVIDHEPPPPPRPIGADDETNEDEPPKPPPRRKKLM